MKPVNPPVQVAPVPAAEAVAVPAAVPEAKRTRQYDLPPQAISAAGSTSTPSVAASIAACIVQFTFAGPTELSPPPGDKHEKKQQQDDDEERMVDPLNPPQPHAPPLPPLEDKQLPASLELSASRSRSRTHSEVYEAPTVAYPDYIPPAPQQSGQGGTSAQREHSAVPAAMSQKNPRVRKIRVRNSGAGNGCANFMDTWKNAFFLQENPCP